MTKSVKTDFRAFCNGDSLHYRELNMTVRGGTTQEIVNDTKRLIRTVLSPYVREVRTTHDKR
ncbi:MAG: hypothetical protein M3Y21_00510 [Candidatus Eremiobacteraeota bacterium]|nr:hypothetical protein [Candidatus Eremiobacteraeota bacterium]